MKTFKVTFLVTIRHKDKDWEICTPRTLTINRIKDNDAKYINCALSKVRCELSDMLRKMSELSGWDYCGIENITEVPAEPVENATEEITYLDSFFDEAVRE